MSRCVLDDEGRETEVVIGWDPGAGSFFARVLDCEAAKRARQHGASEQQIEDAGLALWTGGFDRIYSEPDVLIDAIIPYANPFYPATLRNELMKDRRFDDGNRSYWVVGDEVGGDPSGIENEDDEFPAEGDDEISAVERFNGPTDPVHISEDDVHRALSFLVAIEPDPSTINSIEEYKASMENYERQIELAQRTLSQFAEQIEPKTLEAMQKVYYGLSMTPGIGSRL